MKAPSMWKDFEEAFKNNVTARVSSIEIKQLLRDEDSLLVHLMAELINN